MNTSSGSGPELPAPPEMEPTGPRTLPNSSPPPEPTPTANTNGLTNPNPTTIIPITTPINNPNETPATQSTTRTTRTRHFPFPITFLMNRQGRRRSGADGPGGSHNSFPRMLTHRSAFTYTCFSCLHVRTMTILIGVWYLMLYILILSFMTALLMYHKPDGDGSFGTNTIVTNPVAMTTKHNNNGNSQSLLNVPSLSGLPENDNFKLDLLETTGSSSNGGLQLLEEKNGTPDPKESSMDSFSPTYTNGNGSNHRTNSQFLLLTFCNLLITLLLLYGTLRSKPSYLMPFFILKVFEFCIYCLSMIGLLSYLPNIGSHIIQMQGDSVTGSQTTHLLTPLLSLPPPILSLLTFLFIISSVVIKAYVLNVVWNCYKYLMVRNSMIGVPGSGRWDIRNSHRDSVQFGRVRGLRRLNSFDQWLEDYINNHRNGNSGGAQSNLTGTVDLPDYETAVSDPRYARKPAEGPAGGTTPAPENQHQQRAQVWAPVPPPPEYSQI